MNTMDEMRRIEAEYEFCMDVRDYEGACVKLDDLVKVSPTRTCRQAYVQRYDEVKMMAKMSRKWSFKLFGGRSRIEVSN